MASHETRLSSLEAIALGFVPKERKENNKHANPRYYLNDDQYEQLNKIRDFHNTQFKQVRRTLNEQGNVISSVEKLSPKELIDIPKNHEIKRVSTNVSTQQQWVITEPVKETKIDLEIIKNELLKELQNYVPKYPLIVRSETIKNKRLFVFDPADIHIGKLCSAFEVGETYNNQIAVQRVLKGCKGILNEIRENSIDKVLFVIGNDILHIDNPKRTTTSGTPQDTDGMWHTNFIIAKQLYVDIIEILIGIADVHVVYNPSNHDYTNGFFLAQVIETHFKDCQNVTFDTTIAHRKYFVYGKNLIGTTHGDGAKPQDLPLLMANESKDWSSCKHKYIYTHHMHHKISKDYMSVCVETLRSPSGTDSWHHRNGYQHAPKAVEGYIHDKEHGQVQRLTFIF